MPKLRTETVDFVDRRGSDGDVDVLSPRGTEEPGDANLLHYEQFKT